MANLLPPMPIGMPPDSSFWNDWYEKLRTLINAISTSISWNIITDKPTTLAGYGITDAQTKLNNSAGLAAALSDETGTGLAVFNNTPTLVTPILGVGSATSIRASGGNQIASGTTGASIGTAGAFPQFAWVYSPGAANSKIWDYYADGTNTHFRLVNDAQSGATDWMTVTRSGITVSNILLNGPVSINSSTLLKSVTALGNGAGAGVGTLTNAPTAGNPTKWVPIDDNGTTRYVPAW
jgi:hypothetical protein